MALGMTAAEANGFLDAHLGGSSFAGNANVWVQLHTADPGAAGTTAVATENTRQEATFAAASGGSKSTSADLEWLDVAATETYSHYSLWTASTAGTFLGSGTITGGAVTAGNNFSVPTGDFTVEITSLAA
jgi:hypothetical protein